jgi:hypothetical protein
MVVPPFELQRASYGGRLYPIETALKTIVKNTTVEIVAALTGHIHMMLYGILVPDGTTDITFKSATTAISPIIELDTQTEVLPLVPFWWQTVSGEALQASANTADSVEVLIGYITRGA